MDKETHACLMHFAKALDKIEARLEVFGHLFMKEMYPNDKKITEEIEVKKKEDL